MTLIRGLRVAGGHGRALTMRGMTTDLASPALQQRARALPKVLLHEHLDGGLRVGTLLELLRQRGIEPPAPDEAQLAAWFSANAHAGSLEKYLQGFALTIAAMAGLPALERVAFEAAEDARADGAVLAEFRIAPLLFEPYGISGEAAIEALLAGLARSALPSGLIVCALRHLPPAETTRAARLALAWRGRGVIAFDLAGAEFGFPPGGHAEALRLVRDGGLPLTLHAGEADVAERVVEAAHLGARRIGHGVRLVDALNDPARRHLVDEVRRLGVHLEVCPTINVHTGAAASIAEHPITALWQAGVSLSFHTDNRLMSCVSFAEETATLLRETALTEADLLAMAGEAVGHSFLPEATRTQALAAITAAIRTV